MFKNCCFLSLSLLVLPIGSLCADDRENFPIEAYETVLHPLIDGIQFNRKEVPSREEDQCRFVDPHKSTQDVRHCVLHYNDAPEVLSREHLLIRGEDRRERIHNTTEWPYRTHGSLTLHFGDMKYGGSGVLVGPRHVLTCGHNVYLPGRNANPWVKRILFYPALNEVTAYDVSDVVSIYTFKGWTEGAHTAFELALLVLAKPLGNTIGYHGLAYFDDMMLDRETVDVTGYPGKKGDGQMWSMSGRLKTMEPEKMTYDIDTSEGQSGGAITVFKGSKPYVIGIHTHGQQTGNVGVRLSLDKWRWLVERIAETGDPSTSMESAVAEFQERFADRHVGFGAGELAAGSIIDEQHCLKAVLITDRGRALQKGALAGNPNLQTQFGKALLASWHGAPADNQMSMNWLRLAASQGDIEARKILRDFSLTWPDVVITSLPTFEEMSCLLTVRQTERGERAYQLGIAGKASEQVMVAKQLLENWGGAPQDHRLVVYLLRLAARQEEPEAVQMLARMGLSAEETGRVHFPTLEEVDALIQVLKSHRDGNALYEAAMEGNPYVQTCLGKHLLKYRKGIPKDNRLAIYLLRLAAHRYYGDCAREALKNMNFPNPRGWIDSHPTLEEVQCMMQGIEEEGGMALYQAATENEKPLRLHKRANGAEREACEIEIIGHPGAQKELAQRLLANWQNMLHQRIAQATSGPTDPSVINLMVDEFMNIPCIENLALDTWNIDQLIHALHYTNSTWCGKNDNAQNLLGCLVPKITQLKEALESDDNSSSLGNKRVVFFPGDNWFTFHWLKRAAMSDPTVRKELEDLECDRAEVSMNGLDLSTFEIDYCLTLEEMRCLLATTQIEAGQRLYYSAVVAEKPIAQSQFGKMLLQHWTGEPQDNRLAICWLEHAAQRHEPEAQKILKHMNLHWTWKERGVIEEEEIASRVLRINLRKCELQP